LGKDKWYLRVTVKDSRTGIKRDTNKMLDGVDFTTAVGRWESLRDDTRAELDDALIRPEKKHCEETLTTYSEKWVKHAVRTAMCRPHVLDRTVDSLERQVLPHLGHLRLEEITPPVLARWAEQLSRTRMANGKPYALHTLQGAWRVLRAILNDARTLVGFKVDLDGFEFHVAGTPPKHKDVLTRPEVLAVLDAAKNESPDVCTMVWLGFTTGMRFCELSSLLWEDIDLESGVVKIVRSQVNGHVGPTKTGVHRSVTLLDVVRVMLVEHRQRQSDTLVTPVVPGLVFPSIVGTHKSPSVLIKPLRRCTAKAGVDKNVTAHTMRRTFNNLVRQNAGEIAARAMVGHSTSEMTEHYSDVTVQEKRAAVAAAFGPMAAPKQPSGSTEWVKPVLSGSGGGPFNKQ
jgi:integrase